MIKKILLTAFIIFLMFLLVRWKQKKAQQMQINEVPPIKKNVMIYYLAGGLIGVMGCAFAFWLLYE